MKKVPIGILLTILLLAFSTSAYANSGPVYWQGYPSLEVMSIEANSPIVVENENLVFDFSSSEGFSYSMNGKVTATYQMLNPTQEVQSVQMAFPFIETLDRFFAEEIVITAEGRRLPYELYLGDVVNNHGNSLIEERDSNYDFETIIKTITNEPYKAVNFSETEKGKRYLIEVKPTTDQRVNFAVDFRFNPEQTKILTTGFNRYEVDDDSNTRIAAWCQVPLTLEIFVMGQDIAFQMNGFTDGELEQKTDHYSYQISEQEVELKPYLLDYIKKNSHLQSGNTIPDTQIVHNQLYNLYAKFLDQAFTRNRGYSSEYDLTEQGNIERIGTLVYTVEFPPNSQKEVAVSYKTAGTMDRSKTAKPLYTFDYILNPAKNWSAFKKLQIKILTPQATPYVVANNIELVRGENNVYTATLAGLPEHDFTFTLYSGEKITLWDKIEGEINHRFGYLSFLVIGVMALLIVVLAIKLIRSIRKN